MSGLEDAKVVLRGKGHRKADYQRAGLLVLQSLESAESELNLARPLVLAVRAIAVQVIVDRIENS